MFSFLLIKVPIRPIAKQSTRFGGGRAYTSRRHLDYTRAIATALKQQLEEQPWIEEDTLPISVEIQAFFKWPKSTRKAKRLTLEPRTATPDCDNIAKPILDAMSALWDDDRQVADLRVRKFNGPEDKIIIKVRRWHYPLEPVE